MTDAKLLPVTATAWRYAGPTLAAGVLAALGAGFLWSWLWILASLLLLLGLYVLYFFRDPERKSPNIPGAVVAPADGRVVAVEEIADPRFPEGRARRIAIFLSIFDVHVQRAPFSGEVEGVEHRPGKFLNALNDKCSEDNENTAITFRHGEWPILVRQIAGAIARRIVCPLKSGDQVEKGDRIGLICFGSRVEAYLPLQAEVKVKPGLRVWGGESVLAILDEENPLKGREERNGSQ